MTIDRAAGRPEGKGGKTPLANPPARILVIALSGIGDTLIATPFLHELRIHFPNARIEALVLWPGSKSLLENNPHLDAVLQHDFIRETRCSSLKFVWGLRQRSYDLSVNTHTQGRRGYRGIARLIGARVRLSHEYENQSWADRLLVTHSLPQDYTVHSAVNNQRLLSLIGRTPRLPNPAYELHLRPGEESWADAFIERHGLLGKKLLGVHVGSGGTKNLRLKRWPIERWEEFLQLFRQRFPQQQVLFFGGPEEIPDHEILRARFAGAPFFFPPSGNLREAGALIRRCDGFLSVDTALMHVAAAVRPRYQIVIEAPTLNPTNFPLNPNWEKVPNPLLNGRSLDYYRYDGGPIRGTDQELHTLMASVTAEAVLEAVGRALA